MSIVDDTGDKVEVDVNVIFKEEIECIKIFQYYYQCSEILQRIWTKGLTHVYNKDSSSFETIAQFVLQQTESMLFGFNWNTLPTSDIQQIEEYVIQWQKSSTNQSLRDKCQHILDHIYSPHNHKVLDKLKRVKLTDDWREEAIDYLISERGSTIVHRLKVYSTFPDYSTIIHYARNCWNIISSLSIDHPLSKAISVDEFYSVLAYHITAMYSTNDLNYIFQLIIDMDITETLKLIEKFPNITGEMESNSHVLLDLLYLYHFNEFLRSNDSDTSQVDEHLMVLTNSYCQRYKLKPSNEFGELILKIVSMGTVCPTRKLFIILHVIHNECSGQYLNFKLKLAFLGLTHDFNQLELKKADVEYETADILAAEAELSEFFVFISDVLISFPELYRECMLTAFTLNPNQQMYEKIRQIATSQGLDTFNSMPSGSIPAITNTGYLATVNYNPFEAPNCIMDTNEIDLEVREDLSRAITHPRLKFISWAMPFNEFCETCEKIMFGQKEEFIKNVVASANENLEYVDIDFSKFKDLPEKEGDDGIEKGYHIFLDDDDDSEEDDDKTETSPEAEALIREAEIKLKKRRMVMKRKSTLCKKMMKSGMPMKKILMKCPPRKIPRAPNCNRIDWKHIDELKEYFKEHSHLIKATQMFNDAQVLINNLSELTASKDKVNLLENNTNTAIGEISGDINLNIIPVDPDAGIVVKTSSVTEHENFPNTSLVLPNLIDQEANIAITSNITAPNLPTQQSTSMTLENSCDQTAEITKQLLQLLDDVDADLRLHYRRQKNYLASIKRRTMKSSGVGVVPIKSETLKSDVLDNVGPEDSNGMNVFNTTNMSNITNTSNMANITNMTNFSDIPTEENVNISEPKFIGFEQIKIEEIVPEPVNSIAEIPSTLADFTAFGYAPPNQPIFNEAQPAPPIQYIQKIEPTSTIDDFQPIPTISPDSLNQVHHHYDEIINMVASSSYTEENAYTSVERKKKSKIPKIKKPNDKKVSCKNVITAQSTVATDVTGSTDVQPQTEVKVEVNGTDQNQSQQEDSAMIKPKLQKKKKKLVQGDKAGANDLVNNSQSEIADGQNEAPKKKPRKPRSKNKPKKILASEQSERPDEINVHQIGNEVSANSNNPSNDLPNTKKIKAQRAPRKRKVPKPVDPSEPVYYTPNCKLTDLPDDVLADRGNSYMDSIERAIQKVMAGVTPEEMTMTEIDGVLDNILNMTSGELIVPRNDNETAVENHIRNDSTILEQDYTESFDLALTNDDLYQDANGSAESTTSVEDDKNKVTILSDLLDNEPQYFSTDPSINETNGNMNSTELLNTTDSSDLYENEFNGFAELISPNLIKAEKHTENVDLPTENYASCTLTDISYNTKKSSAEAIDTNFLENNIKVESSIDVNDCQSNFESFEKAAEENLPESEAIAQPETTDTSEIVKSEDVLPLKLDAVEVAKDHLPLVAQQTIKIGESDESGDILRLTTEAPIITNDHLLIPKQETAQQPILLPDFVQPQLAIVQHSIVQPIIVQPTIVQPTTVQPTIVQPTIVQPTIVQSTIMQPTIELQQPAAVQLFESIPKCNGNTEIVKPVNRSTSSSLRFVRKPNHQKYSSALPKIKTKKFSIRLDRSIVDDYISSRGCSLSNLMNKASMQPIVILKRIEDDDSENSVKRSQSRRIGKRKQNRAVWDGEIFSHKNTFKRRRDDSDDAEGSSGFSGGSGNFYSSDSQSGTSTSSTRETIDSPPSNSTNGGSSESSEDSCENLSILLLSMKLRNFRDEDENFGGIINHSGKLNTQKDDNLRNKSGDLTSVIINSSNCNLISSVSTRTNKLSYFKPIQTSAKFANLDTVLSHLVTLNKLKSILKPLPKSECKIESNLILPNLLKSVPGIDTFEHFLAPAHHRYQTVEIVQLAKQLLPASGDCNDNDNQHEDNLSPESTSKIIPTIEASINYNDVDNTLSRVSSPPTTKINNTSMSVAQQIITPTTITPHIQKIGQPTSGSNSVTFSNRAIDNVVSVPTTRNNSVAVVFVKSPDRSNQSGDSFGNNNRCESTVIKVNSEQQQHHQQKVVQLCAQLSQNQQNSPQLAKILNKPISQSSSQQHLLQILNAPPSRNLNNNLFTATATNGNIVSGGSSGSIVTFASNNGGSSALPNNLYICKTDGKTIQLTPLTNNRLVTTSIPNVKTALNGFYINNNLKKTVNQSADESKSSATATTTTSMEMAVQSYKNNQTTVVKSQINTRSMYEENYAKFIQTATNKTQSSTNEISAKTSVGNEVNTSCVITSTVQSNTLPKFNHVFGKTILSSDTIAASQTKTTTSTITLTVSDDDNDPPSTSVCQDAATQTSVTINKGKHSKKILQTFIKDVKMNDNPSNNEKQKLSSTTNHVIYARQMPAQQFNQSTILQGINRMIQSTSVGSNNISTTAAKKDIKIIHQPMSSSLSTGMRISMPMVTSSMQQIQTTKLIRPVIQLPQTILRSTGQGENRQQFLITTPGDPSSNIRYENLIVTATASGQSTQSSNRNVDNSTLEQLREFDMVLEQVKERSTTTLITAPNQSSNISLKQSVNHLLTSGENQIVQGTPDIIYTSNGQSVIQKVNLAYVQQHNLHNTPLVVVTNYCQPKASSSLTPQNASVVSTSLTSPNKIRNSNAQVAATQISLKSTQKVATKPIIERSTVAVTSIVPKYTSTIATAVTNSILSSTPIITTTAVSNNTTVTVSSVASSAKPPPKLQEDEQTVQRIYNILAEYAEQLRNSPDLNNKPAPRRRCNIPSSNASNAATSSNASTTSSNTSSTSKKRKSSQSSSSKRSANENDLDRTLESEDSSGISLHDQNNFDETSQHSLSNATEKSPPVLVTSVPNSCVGLSSNVLTPIARSTVSRQLIFADSVVTLCSSTGTSTSTSLSSANNARQVLINDSTGGKVGNETALLMPRNYVLPMSVIKSGGQQYAIVASTAQASKLLETGQLKHLNNNELWQQQRSTGMSQSAIVLQGFLNKNFPRTSSLQPEQAIKQPMKIQKSNTSQTFSNIEEAANALCQTRGNGGGAIFLQTIPTISSAPSTVLNSLVTSEAQSHNISAFARVPQQPKQSQPDLQTNEQQHQPTRGIIIIENVKEEEKDVTTATTNNSTTTLVAKKRKFQEDDNSFNSSLIKNELKWSSDQYLEPPTKSEYMMKSLSDQKEFSASMSPTSSITNTTKISPATTSTSITETSKIITIPSSTDEHLRFLISNPYQVPAKTKGELRNKHLRNNFILNTNGSSTGNRILLQQLCHERKQAAIERELRLQKSLSEECEDLGTGEPSTSDLFPEADLLFDTCSPAFDVSSHIDNTSTPIDISKQRIFFHTAYQTATHRSNDCEDVKSSDDDEKRCKLIKTINDGTFKGSTTPNFLHIKEETYGDFEVISPYVQENSNSSTGINETKTTIKVEQQNDDDVNERDDETEEFTADIAGDFDKLKNSMDWEGGPKKTYSKSTFRGVKRTQESALTSIIKTVSRDSQSTIISVTSPASVLHQPRITQYKKKIPFNHKLNACKSSSINSSITKHLTQPVDATLINRSESKNNLISVQRKRRLSLSSSKSGEQSTKSNCTTTPYIHNHSIGSMSGNISSSFKIVNTDAMSAAVTMSSTSAASSSPKIINHHIRTGGHQVAFDKDVIYGTVNGSNAKANKHTKKR